MDYVVFKLTAYFRNVISFSDKPKPLEFSKFRTFSTKLSILAYISLEIGNFYPSHDYDVTMTSYVECWYVEKEETISYTMITNEYF